MDKTSAKHYAKLTKDLAENAKRCVRDIDPTDELVMFRVETKKNEMFIAPGPGESNHIIIYLGDTCRSSCRFRFLV